MLKRSWFPYEPGEWLADSHVQACNLKARGLYMEIISRMHFAENYGILSQEKVSTICRNLRIFDKTEQKLTKLLCKNELLAKLPNGDYSCPKMLKKKELSETRKEIGSIGEAYLLEQGDVSRV